MSTETVFVNQFNTGCLSQLSYYIESNKEAIIIDPMREYQPYLDFLTNRNATLKYILQTHIHSDFVSSHIDLSYKTGATIIYGPKAICQYKIQTCEDNEELPLGNVKIKVKHTPGHTIESTCYLVLDQSNKILSVFTGDTLLVGSIARPDLSVPQSHIQRELAIMYYHSIHNVLKSLPDDVLIYPGHTNGTACTTKVSSELTSTIGKEKQKNPFMQAENEEEFMSLLRGLCINVPQYYTHTVQYNINGYEFLDDSINSRLKPLEISECEELIDNGCIFLDTRDPEIAIKGYIPGSILISLKSQYSRWAGSLIKPYTKIIIVCEEGKEKESIVRLLRIGYYSIVGYLKGGVNSWKNDGPLMNINYIEQEQVPKYLYDTGYTLLDLREEYEYENGTLPNCLRMPLSMLEKNFESIPLDKTIYLFCTSGIRSLMAISILIRIGFDNLYILPGGTLNIIKNKIGLMNYEVDL